MIPILALAFIKANGKQKSFKIILKQKRHNFKSVLSVSRDFSRTVHILTGLATKSRAIVCEFTAGLRIFCFGG